MPLIIKSGKELKVVSKAEMKEIISNIENNKPEAVLKGLSPEVAERRKETLTNKLARENAALMLEKKTEANSAKLEKEQIQIAIEDKVKDAVVETVAPITVDTNTSSVIIDTKEEKSEKSTPDFTNMTKKEIDVWAEENLGIQLDRRNTKVRMIEDLNRHL